MSSLSNQRPVQMITTRQHMNGLNTQQEQQELPPICEGRVLFFMSPQKLSWVQRNKKKGENDHSTGIGAQLDDLNCDAPSQVRERMSPLTTPDSGTTWQASAGSVLHFVHHKVFTSNPEATKALPSKWRAGCGVRRAWRIQYIHFHAPMGAKTR